MSEDYPRSPSPSRKPIILIGAPSGAGKTVLSQKIINGALPLFADLCGGVSPMASTRHDLQLLPDDPPRDQTLIIECATHNLAKTARSEQWRRMLTLVQESEKVICVTLDIPRHMLAWQYFMRIFTLPKRDHVIKRVLQVSKYRNTLLYMLTRRLARANAAWLRFGRALSEELSPRVAIVYARRRGSEYHFTME